MLIGDVNDHWPQFMNSPYVAYVPTGMAAGEFLLPLKSHIVWNVFVIRLSDLFGLICVLSFRLSCLCSKSNRWRH